MDTMKQSTRTSKRDLEDLNLIAKALRLPVYIDPRAYGASVRIEGMDTYYRTNTEAYRAANAYILARM